MSYLGPVSSNQDGTIINYIPYGTIENNTTRGWSACTLTWSGNAPSGAPTLTATQMAISASSTDPLSSLYSLLLTKSAANAQYQGFVSDAFTIKREDLAKVLTGSFYYEVASGTVDMSGSSTQSLEIWVYNVNANQWIQPAGYRGLNQSSGPGLVSFTFQTDSTAANNSYRIAVITQQTSATAYTVKFDDFKLSPQTAPIGPVMTDFQSYTATTSGFNIGTTGTATTRWRRVGDSIHVIGRYVAGGTGISVSGDLRVFLPTGLSFDTSKISLFSTVGAFELHNAGAYRYGGATLAVDTTQVAFSIRQNAATLGNFAGTQTPEVGWFNAGNDEISFEFMAPISGWSSNVQLSNDTDTRVVDFRAYTTTARTVNNSAPTIIFENVEKDSHGAYNASTGVYTVPVSGDYVVSGQMRIGSLTMTAGAFFGFSAAVDGVYTVRHHYTAFRAVVASSAFNFAEGSGSVLLPNLRAGQTIQVRAWGDNATATFTDGANSFCIQRISGPSVVAASETVAVSATRNAGNYAVNNSTTTFVWNIADIDTHASLNTSTGVFTAPVSGAYEITASTTVFSSVSQLHSTTIRINGADSANSFHVQDSTNTNYRTLVCNYIVRLNAGSTLDVRVFSSGSATWIGNNGTVPRLTIKRIGN